MIEREQGLTLFIKISNKKCYRIYTEGGIIPENIWMYIKFEVNPPNFYTLVESNNRWLGSI